jgi:hypothetical protein
MTYVDPVHATILTVISRGKRTGGAHRRNTRNTRNTPSDLYNIPHCTLTLFVVVDPRGRQLLAAAAPPRGWLRECEAEHRDGGDLRGGLFSERLRDTLRARWLVAPRNVRLLVPAVRTDIERVSGNEWRAEECGCIIARFNAADAAEMVSAEVRGAHGHLVASCLPACGGLVTDAARALFGTRALVAVDTRSPAASYMFGQALYVQLGSVPPRRFSVLTRQGELLFEVPAAAAAQTTFRDLVAATGHATCHGHPPGELWVGGQDLLARGAYVEAWADPADPANSANRATRRQAALSASVASVAPLSVAVAVFPSVRRVWVCSRGAVEVAVGATFRALTAAVEAWVGPVFSLYLAHGRWAFTPTRHDMLAAPDAVVTKAMVDSLRALQFRREADAVFTATLVAARTHVREKELYAAGVAAGVAHSRADVGGRHHPPLMRGAGDSLCACMPHHLQHAAAHFTRGLLDSGNETVLMALRADTFDAAKPLVAGFGRWHPRGLRRAFVAAVVAAGRPRVRPAAQDTQEWPALGVSSILLDPRVSNGALHGGCALHMPTAVLIARFLPGDI